MLELISSIFGGSMVTTCLVGLGTGLFVYWLINKMKYNYPPGPWCPPLIGHLWTTNMNNMLYDAAKWSDKYGPVVTVYLGPYPMVIVNKIDAALEVLVKKSTEFANRPHAPSFDVFTSGGKDIAFSDYGATWKLHRRISSKALRNYMQGSALEQRLESALESAFEELDKHLDGKPFDNMEYINYIVGNILTGLCFGGKYTFADKEVNYMLEKEDEIFSQLGNGVIEDLIPWIMYFYKSKGFRALEEMNVILEDFLGKRVKEAKATFDRNNIRHFTDNLILARLEAEEEEGSEVLNSLTDEHIVQTISDIFFAGIDTSRFTLGFAILHMIAFPEIQVKVQEEIDKVVGKDRLPHMEDRPQLPYTEAVLHESMRLASVAPGGLTHATSSDTTLCGYKIPKGTAVTVNHWALHYDPEAWPDVEKFVPERYLDEDGKLGPKPKNWLPFSAGKRVCLGEFVAKPELHLLFASLMQKYQWKREDGVNVDIGAITASLSRVAKPYKCIITKRV